MEIKDKQYLIEKELTRLREEKDLAIQLLIPLGKGYIASGGSTLRESNDGLRLELFYNANLQEAEFNLVTVRGSKDQPEILDVHQKQNYSIEEIAQIGSELLEGRVAGLFAKSPVLEGAPKSTLEGYGVMMVALAEFLKEQSKK